MLGCLNTTPPFVTAVPVGISTGSPAGPCASTPPRPSPGATGLKPLPAAREGRGAARVPTRRRQTPGSAACHCCLPCLRSEEANVSEVRRCPNELRGAFSSSLNFEHPEDDVPVVHAGSVEADGVVRLGGERHGQCIDLAEGCMVPLSGSIWYCRRNWLDVLLHLLN